MRTIFACLLAVACTYHGTAQGIPEKTLQFEGLNIKDGLSQGAVSCVLQDHYGFMWFATKDGLDRYDGYQFTVFRHNPADTTTIADNYVKYIFEDSKNRLWVGTANKGLDMFNPVSEAFTHFTPNATGVNGYTHNNIEKIAEDKQGNIWIMHLEGLTVAVEQPASKPASPVFVFKQVENRHVQMYCASDGNVWVSQLGGGLYTVNNYGKKNQQVYTIPLGKYCWYPPAHANDTARLVKAFVEDTAAHKLYLVTDYSVTSYDEKLHAFTISRTNQNLWGQFNPFGGMGDGVIWLARNFEIYRFKISTGEISKINGTTQDVGMAMKTTACFFTDKSGLTWVGTGGYGILKYNPLAEKLNREMCGTVGCVQADENGQALVVENYGNLGVFNKETGRFYSLLPPKLRLDIAKEEGGVYFEFVLPGGNNTFWLSKGYLRSYDTGTKKLTTYNKNAFPFYKSRGGDGMLWFGSDSAFCSYNGTTKQFTAYAYPIAAANTAYHFLQAIYQDAEGVFWLGTTDGLLRFNRARQQWTRYANDPHNDSSLSFNLIFSLLPDPLQPEKYLWVGTNGGGLNRFNMQTGRVARYSTKSGLANDVVYGILSDSSGNLWMSTNNGLSRLNIKTGQFRNYTEEEGLQGNEFNRNAFCKTTDGTLFFGGVKGFNYFNPALLHDNTHVPAIAFTGFRISNKPVGFAQNNSPLAVPVNLTGKIVLPYSDNMISFDFAALDFTAPQKNQFSYKLQGFDNDWINAGTAHTATYTNLDPGTYTLMVKASNDDGVWGETSKNMVLVILPPWYMTWWFRTLAALAACGALYTFYRYRLNQALKLVAVRNRIATDLHDEIGSNLSNISIFSEVAQQKGGDNAALLQKISGYTATSMEAMSDIVWMVNARNDRFENIVSRMRYLAAEVLEAKNYTVHIDIDEKLNSLVLGMELRKNFYLVYKEAINNIAKYACGKNAWVAMHVNNQQLVLTVKDDGKGFNTQAAGQGNGLRNMQKRAENIKGRLHIDSSPGGGTCITLQFRV